MELRQFFSNAKELSVKRNEVIHRPDEKCVSLEYVLSGENYRGWLTAEEPAMVLENPAFKHLYFHEISERVSTMTERIEVLSFKKVSDRLILYFLNHFEEGRVFNINISALADELDCSREALSRAVSELGKEKALSKEGSKITILSLSLLEKQLSFF